MFQKSKMNLKTIFFMFLWSLNTLSTSAKIESSHREFQRLTGAGSCRYVPDKRVLCLIVSIINIQRDLQL